MTLEDRIAYWTDLGMTDYKETEQLQERLARLRQEERIPDIILTTQHYPEVNFGKAIHDNLFSNEFLAEVGQEFGHNYTQENVLALLKKKGFGFSQSSRGGGATIIAPGQLIYYPIVDHQKITEKLLDLQGYKSKIYHIMFNTLAALGVNGLNISPSTRLATRKERRDVWLSDGDVSLKLGSRGIFFSRNVAYHGFALYIDASGVQQFQIVKPCGYEPDQVAMTSVEDCLGRKVDHDTVHRHVRENIQKTFGYSGISQFPIDKLRRKAYQRAQEVKIAAA